ncbi:unnamed protein product [Cyprideis torosa]|uniref:Uncharacterized protein n=1 Tax=Cyprideis torosa TaxID=163714 RepID=A0A7R8ZJT4_9CRUS|nr:unnamed protein product [Cyprideis torosa]CAG0882977.1 unnamed protein product [Cyprideis torosa]
MRILKDLDHRIMKWHLEALKRESGFERETILKATGDESRSTAAVQLEVEKLLVKAKSVRRQLKKESRAEEEVERGDEEQRSEDRRGGSSRIQLPAYRIPTFTGKYEDFSTFWDLYYSTVDSQDLSGAQKFAFLLNALEGPPKTLISQFQPTDGNYPKAVEMLKETYDRPHLVIQSQWKALHSLKPVINHKHQECRKQWNTVETHIRTLEALNAIKKEDSVAQSFLPTFILGLFPKDFAARWERKCKAEEYQQKEDFDLLSEVLACHLWVTDRLCPPVPRKSCPPDTSLFPLADDLQGGRIDIIIGSDNYYLFMKEEQRSITPRLRAINSVLGWVFHGMSPYPSTRLVNQVYGQFLSVPTSTTFNSVSHLRASLWDVESLGIFAEEETEDITSIPTWNQEEGRYQVGLLWKGEERPINNFHLTESRYQRSIKNLKGENKDTYHQYMKEKEDQHIIRESKKEDIDSTKALFLPHHGVFRGGRLRVVFDAGTRDAVGKPLNSYMVAGDNRLRRLYDVMMRFRQKEVAFQADIASAFHTILTLPEDLDHHLSLYEKEFPFVRSIQAGTYMDDVSSTHNDWEEANYVSEKIQSIFEEGGMPLHKVRMSGDRETPSKFLDVKSVTNPDSNPDASLLTAWRVKRQVLEHLQHRWTRNPPIITRRPIHKLYSLEAAPQPQINQNVPAESNPADDLNLSEDDTVPPASPAHQEAENHSTPFPTAVVNPQPTSIPDQTVNPQNGYKMKKRIGAMEELPDRGLSIAHHHRHFGLATPAILVPCHSVAVILFSGDDPHCGRHAHSIGLPAMEPRFDGFYQPWATLYHSKEQYSLRYESKYLLELGQAMDYLVSFAVSMAAQEALKYTILAGLVSAIMWPASALTIASVIDNPWGVCCRRSAEEMAKAKNCQGIIQDVVLLGAPVSGSHKLWEPLGKVVSGRIINGYSRGDWLLKFLYRTSSMNIHIAGLGGLAAPLIGAGVGTILGGASAAAIGSTAGMAVLVLGSAFGVAGAGLSFRVCQDLHSWFTERVRICTPGLQDVLRFARLIYRVCQGLVSAIMWPASALTIASVIDNPWGVCCRRSAEVGKQLAQVLLSREHGHRPVTLIGFSLGARVIHFCLVDFSNASSLHRRWSRSTGCLRAHPSCCSMGEEHRRQVFPTPGFLPPIHLSSPAEPANQTTRSDVLQFSHVAREVIRQEIEAAHALIDQEIEPGIRTHGQSRKTYLAIQSPYSPCHEEAMEY